MAEQRLIAPTDKGGTTLEVEMLASMVDSGVATVEFTKAEPELRLKKWDAEINLGVRCNAVVSAPAIVEDSKVKWVEAEQELHAYPLIAGKGMEDGGLEIELFLKSSPPTNVFAFPLTDWEDLGFWYQAPLTDKEKAEGHSRPENVEGSFAVYHKTKRHHKVGATNYATGKAFHIYRPKVIDALGVETWGELSYADGVLSVTVPQAFLDAATYPVLIDPTFGYTTIGGTTYSSSSSAFTEGTLTEAGDLTLISFYSQGIGGAVNTKGLLYTDVADVVTTVVAVGDPVSVPDGVLDWRDSAASGALSAGDFYVGHVGESGVSFNYDSVGGFQSHYVCDTSYASPGNSPTCTGGFSGRFSMYATYTAAGGGGSPWYHYSQQ